MSVMQREITARPRRTCAQQVEGGIVSLEELQHHLHDVFQSDDVNIELVEALLRAYKSNPQDWKNYAKFDRYKYTRNLVDEGNGKFNLMLLCWSEGQDSAVHDHSNAHCFMKILQGSLCEIRYDWPKKEEENNEETSGLKELSRTVLPTDDVCYINDSLGLHRVENTSHTEPAVSLHLYCPPFNSCSVFDQRTGHRTKCQVTFWSKYGERINYCTKETDNNNQSSSSPPTSAETI